MDAFVSIVGTMSGQTGGSALPNRYRKGQHSPPVMILSVRGSVTWGEDNAAMWSSSSQVRIAPNSGSPICRKKICKSAVGHVKVKLARAMFQNGPIDISLEQGLELVGGHLPILHWVTSLGSRNLINSGLHARAEDWIDKRVGLRTHRVQREDVEAMASQPLPATSPVASVLQRSQSGHPRLAFSRHPEGHSTVSANHPRRDIRMRYRRVGLTPPAPTAAACERGRSEIPGFAVPIPPRSGVPPTAALGRPRGAPQGPQRPSRRQAARKISEASSAASQAGSSGLSRTPVTR